MNFFTRFSLRNVSAVILLCLMIIGGGIYSGMGLKKETMPDINIPIVGIVTVYPGAAPGDVLDKVSKPMEEAVASVPGLQGYTSTSSENVSTVIARFDYSEDMDKAQQQVEQAIKDVQLPDNALAPKIMRINFGSFPVLNLSITHDSLSPEDLEQQVREKILPALSGVSGVGSVSVFNESQRSVYVRLLPDKLKEYNLTSQTVLQLLQANNLSIPAGTVKLDGTVQPIRVSGVIADLDALKNLRLPVAPNAQEMLTGSLSQIGEGMNTLGEKMGELGSGVASLGSAVGELGAGMAGLNQSVSAQVQLLSTLSDLQSQLLGAQMSLMQANMVLKDPAASEKDKQQAQMTSQQLIPTIQTLEAGIAQVKEQLKLIQQQSAKAGNQAAIPSAAPGASSAQPNENQTAQQPEGSVPDLSTLETIRLQDIADITVESGTSTAYSRTNGVPSVILEVAKSQDANTILVSKAVLAKLDEIKKDLPEGTGYVTILDQSLSVQESISGMLKEGLLGALFAFIVILLFLRNMRTTLIASLSIPLSILITMLFMQQSNITLNIITMAGLSVAVGRIVDDSIVVIENIHRHLQSHPERNENMILVAVKEVASAITSSTLTTVAVFLPMAFVGGLAGTMFKPFASTVAIALISSLIVAVTVIPVLSKMLMMRGGSLKHTEFHESRLMKWYQGVLTWSLNHKLAVLLGAVLLLAGSASLIKVIGTSFMPEEKEKYVSITLDYPAGTDLTVVDAKAREVEDILKQKKDIDLYQATIGKNDTSSYGSAVGGSGAGNYLIKLNPDANVDTWVQDLRKEIKPDTLGTITVNQTNVSSTSGSGEMNNLEVLVKGDSIETITKTVQELKEKLTGLKGLENLSDNLSESKPEILIDVNQEKATALGLSAGQVGMYLRELLNDNAVTTTVADGRTMDVRVGLKLNAVSKLSDIQNIVMTSPTGTQVKLSEVAKITEVPGPVSIYHENGKEYAMVTAKIIDKNTGAISSKVQEIVDSMTLPQGTSISMGGVTSIMSDTFRDLIFAMIVAVFAVFFVMLIAFGELSAPLAIMFSLPLAAIGGLLALFITGLPLDMPSMVGGLMLIGIVVTNAIVLIDRVQHKRQEGMPLREALLEAGRIRMRPILMTAIATIAALVPLALGFSKGSVTSQSLAVIVIGGLTTSTFLTLVIVPVAFELLENIKRKARKPQKTIEGPMLP